MERLVSVYSLRKRLTAPLFQEFRLINLMTESPWGNGKEGLLLPPGFLVHREQDPAGAQLAVR